MKTLNLTHILRRKSNIHPEILLNGNFITTFLNPYSYSIARKHTSLLNEFDAVYIDGISLVRLMNILGLKCKRYSFDMTSIAKYVFEYLNNNDKSIYFIGSKQEEIEQSISNFQELYPRMNILGFRNGYLDNNIEWQQEIEQIIELNPDFVVVGMGTPVQEKFLIDLKTNGFNGSGFTCGGFLHQSAQSLDYYPSFYNRFNLRWLYRIFDEPKLLKRYALDYPRGFFNFIFDFYR